MSILLIGYGVFLLVLAAFGVSAIYHANKFGFPGDKTKLGVMIYLVAAGVIVLASFVLLGTTDFSGEAAEL